MAEEQTQILLSVITSLETLSYVRNQDEKRLAIDITENEDINNQTFTLQRNSADGNNLKSSKTLEEIESFLYVYSPYPIEGIFIKPDNSTFTLNIVDLIILRDAFTSVTLKNTDQVNAATIKVIYS